MKVTLCCVDSCARVKREDKIAENDVLRFVALKNGYDSAQVIVHAEEVLSLSLTAKDLQNENGDVLSKDNFKFFYEKYIYIDRNWQKNGFSTGWYPDALIPCDAPILHGENVVQAGDNGGIWIDVKIPEKQPCGVYKGLFTLDVGENIEVEVVLEVLDAIQPYEMTHKSIFTLNGFHMAHHEGECSEEMMDAYNQCMLEHRICSAIPAGDGKREWIEDALRYIRQGASTVNIPAPDQAEKHEKFGGIPDFDDLTKKLVAVLEKSLKINENLFPYMAYYDWRIDEPFFCKYPNGKVKYLIEEYQKTIKKVVEQYRDDSRLQTEFGKELLASLQAVPHIVTDQYDRPKPNMHPLLDENGSVYAYDIATVTLCPKFDGYDDENQRRYYQNAKEKWWYGCNGPNAPFPGYHIDDAGYVARYVGWLMADYDITGNLYWACNFFQECNTTGVMQFFDDPYSLAHLGFGANGDGAILYPGKSYGVKGPNVSMRVKAIRAGYEEYELLRILKEGYKEKDFDFHEILACMVAGFADGVRLDPNFNGFNEIRNTILRLYELFVKYGFILAMQPNENGWNISYHTHEPIELLVNGNAVQDTLFMGWHEGGFKLVVNVQNQTIAFTIPCDAPIKVILHEELYKRNAVSGDLEELSINYDEIRRKINIIPKEKNSILYIEPKEDLNSYQAIDFLLRTKQPISYKIYNEEELVTQGTTIVDWNRIHTENVMWKTGRIRLQLDRKALIGLGEMYFTPYPRIEGCKDKT